MKIVKPKVIIFDWNGTLVYNDEDNLIHLLPNVLQVLKKLNELNILVSIISNTYIAFLNRTVKKFKIDKYLLNVIGTKGDIDYRKPSKEVVDYALIGADVDDINTDTVWMVGNSMQDIYTAYNSHIRPVIFGRDLLMQILLKEGIEPKKNALYFKNYNEFLEMLEEFKNENA